MNKQTDKQTNQQNKFMGFVIFVGKILVYLSLIIFVGKILGVHGFCHFCRENFGCTWVLLTRAGSGCYLKKLCI
jgi:hypothetical protein